jgi:uncharacterized protein
VNRGIGNTTIETYSIRVTTTVASLADAQYISLRTFKKNGESVDTALWFAIDHDKIYAYSDAQSWKVRRMRNNSKVEVAPCSMKGVATGEFVPATAVVLPDDQIKYVHGLLNSKYTWKKRLMEVLPSLLAVVHLRQAKPDAVFEITLDN